MLAAPSASNQRSSRFVLLGTCGLSSSSRNSPRRTVITPVRDERAPRLGPHLLRQRGMPLDDRADDLVQMVGHEAVLQPLPAVLGVDATRG